MDFKNGKLKSAVDLAKMSVEGEDTALDKKWKTEESQEKALVVSGSAEIMELDAKIQENDINEIKKLQRELGDLTQSIKDKESKIEEIKKTKEKMLGEKEIKSTGAEAIKDNKDENKEKPTTQDVLIQDDIKEKEADKKPVRDEIFDKIQAEALKDFSDGLRGIKKESKKTSKEVAKDQDLSENNKSAEKDNSKEIKDVVLESINDFRKGLNKKSNEAENIDRIMERREKETSDPLIQEAREKRTQILEDRGLLQMSKEDFKKYFVAGKFDIINKLRQTNVGDCYAIAAIHAMSESPHFEVICRSSMKKMPDGSWEVKIPLLSDEGEVIKITPEELRPQRNKKFLKGSMDGGIVPDYRFKLKPLSGKEGLKVLEAAFIKKKFGSVDRLASEGGWGDDTLFTLGGDNFKKFGIDCFRKFNVEKQKWDFTTLSSLSKEKMEQLEHYLENFSPETDIATANTKNMNPGTISGIIASGTQFFKGEGTMKLFVPGHAYSLLNVDSARRMITLANPWNTMNSIKLTFEQFKGIFDSVRSVRIDNAKMLKNMETILEKAA